MKTESLFNPMEEERNILPPLQNTDGAYGKITVRGLAEGAMMIALTMILIVIGVYVPILNILARLLSPMPLSLVVLRHGLKLGLICGACVLFLSIMLLGFAHAVLLFIQFSLLGLFFGWCFRQKIRPAITLFGGVMISSVALVCSIGLFSFVAGISLAQYQEIFRQIITDYVNMVQQNPNAELIMRGMTPAAYLAYMEDFFDRLLPSMLIISAMMITWVCYVLMCKLLRRFGHEIARLPIYSEWRLDWRFLWALIIALAMSGLGERFGFETISIIGDNLLLVFFPILLLCGFSMVVWLLKYWHVSTFIKVLVVVFAVQVFGGGLEIMALIGVFDPLFDFRRRILRWQEKKQAG